MKQHYSIFRALIVTWIMMSMFTSTIQAINLPPIDELIELDLNEELQEHLQSLSLEEQKEQLRDWIVISANVQLNASEKDQFASLYDFPAMRYDYIAPLSNFSYGAMRYLRLEANQVAIFVPKNSAKKQTLIAEAVDEYRMIAGDKPTTVLQYEYEIDGENRSANFVFKGTKVGKSLFANTFGYIEQKITSRQQLASFLKKIDNLTYARTTSTGLLLGGRQFDSNRKLGISLEEAAAIYRADENLIEEFEKRMNERGLENEYNRLLRLGAEEAMLGAGDELSYTEVVEMMQLFMPYETFKENTIQDFIENYDLNIGFSLDPKTKYWTFTKDLEAHLNQDQAAKEKYFEQSFKSNRDYLELNKNSFFIELMLMEFDEADYLDNNNSSISISSFINGNKSQADIPSEFEGKKVQKEVEAERKKSEKLDALANKITQEEYEELQKVIEKYQPELQVLVEDSKKDKFSSYYDLRQYLSGESISLIIRAGDENYRVRDVKEMFAEIGDSVNVDSWLFDSHLENLVIDFQNQNELKSDGIVGPKTWEILTEKAEDKQSELETIDGFLGTLNKNHSYQHGRYDGYLQGTSIGMNLYYTDLMMKLWSFNYQNTAPELEVEGFLSKPSAKISPVYWKEIWDFPSTRSWLGSLENGMDFHNNNELFFSHVATKIYNASSNDLFPGAEIAANPASERFSNWWNNHYNEVAEYEPQFHKLNQIMKWSALIAWLKTKEDDSLTFLRGVKVNRNLDFEKWYYDNDDLKTRVDLPFVSKEKVGRTTECLELIQSSTFEGYGMSGVYLTGGVTLPGKKIVKTRMSTPKNISKGVAPKGVKSSSQQAGRLKFEDYNARVVDVNLNTKQVKVNSELATKGRNIEVSKGTLQKRINQKPNQLAITEDINGIKVSKLEINKVPNTSKVELKLSENIVQKAQRTIEDASGMYGLNLSKLQKSNNFSDIIRLKGDRILCKTASSEKQWVLIQPLAKATPVSSRLSFKSAKVGTSATDIRKIDFITEAQANQLIPNNTWQKISNTSTGKGGKAVIDFIENPPITAKKVYLQNGPNTKELIVSEGNIWIKSDGALNSTLTSTKAIRQEFDGNHFRLIKSFEQSQSNSVLVLKTKKGEFVTLSENISSTNNLSQTVQQLSKNGTNIDGVLFTDKATGVNCLQNRGLELPKTIKSGSADFEVATSLLNRARENPSIYKAFTNSKVTKGDLEFIQKIDFSNDVFISSYPQYRAAASRAKIPADGAFIDLRTANSKMQFVHIDKSGKVAINNYGKQVDITKINETLKKAYDNKSAFSEQELLKMTKPYIDYVDHIIKTTGKKRFVTKEHDFVDIQQIVQFHKSRGVVSNNIKTARFYKDQLDIVQSIENFNQEVYPELSKTIVLAPFSFSDSTALDTAMLALPISTVKNSTIQVLDELTWTDFQKIMLDSTYQQLFWITQTDDNYYFQFADKVVGWYSIWSLLNEMEHKKDFLYIYSNNGEATVSEFAESGNFKRVYFADFRLGDLGNFKFGLGQIAHYLKTISVETFEIPNKKFKKLLKKNPVLTKVASIKQAGKNTIVEISKGKLAAINPSLKSKLGGYFTPNNVLQSNTNQLLLTDLNDRGFKINPKPIDAFGSGTRIKLD